MIQVNPAAGFFGHLAAMDFLADLCGPNFPDAASASGYLGAMLLAGLSVGVLHCAAMCGPFVLAQATDRLARVPSTRLCAMTRLSGGLLLPYHAGRLATYMLLGALAGATGGGLASLPWFGKANAVLLAFAGMAMILGPAWSGRTTGGFGRFLGRGKIPLDRLPASLRSLGLGVVLGFLPCGSLYAALLAASAAGRPAAGATAMFVFGIGTIPALAGIGMFGAHAVRRWWPRALDYRPALLAANGGLLLVLAAIAAL